MSHPTHQSFNTASSHRLNIPDIQPGPTSFTKDKKIRIIDDPFLVPDPSPRAFKSSQASSSNKPQVISGFIDLTISSNEGGSDDALEYLTPPPTPAPSSQRVAEIVEEVPLIVTSNQVPPPLPRDARPTAQTPTMTTTPEPPNQLLTRWLNDRSTTAGVKLDLWARACLRRDHDAGNRRSLGNEVRLAPLISPPARRKYKSHKLNEGYRAHSFFLSAESWLREKQASLLLE